MAIAVMWVALLLAVPAVEAQNHSAASLSLHNPVVVGLTSITPSLDPTVGSNGWSLIAHGIAEKLFTVDQSGNIVGQVAASVSNIDTSTWEVTLRDNYMFSDGVQVTAQHIVAALTELNTDNTRAQASLGTGMTVTAVDNLRVRIVSTRTTPIMDSVLAEVGFPVYRRQGNDFVFTGPYAVESFEAGVGLALTPNTHYSQASERPLVTIRHFATEQLLANALQAGQLDMAFHLSVALLPPLRQTDGLTIKSFVGGYHYMMIHNTRSYSHLSDVRVRRAVDLALDRSALAQAVSAGSGTRSFFPAGTPWFLDNSNAHGDRTQANALLEEAGWVRPSSGAVRMKNGVPLNMYVVAYQQRPDLPLMLPEIETTLTALGINVTTHVTSGAGWDELDGIMDCCSYNRPTFDLLLWAQNTLPAGDPQYFLSRFFRSDGGANYAALNSSTIDGLLDTLGQTTGHANRVSAAAAVHTAVHAEVSVSNLMTPEWHVGFSRRLSEYTPWGADYYVIRSDLFVSAMNTTTATPSSGGQNENDASRGSWAIPGGLPLVVMLFFAF